MSATGYYPKSDTEGERIGKDDRRAVGDPWAVPFRWICSLRVTYAPGPATRGTGVLVGPRQPVGTFAASRFSVPEAFLTPPRGQHEKGPRGLRRRHRHDHARPGHRRPGPPRHTHAYLTGKGVSVAGYPTDRCGGKAFDPGIGCDRQDFASVPFHHPGTVSFTAALPGLLLHTADTFKGQSGAPVRVRTVDGSRYLVGIHLGARLTRSGTTHRRLPVTTNKARHLDSEALALIRSWMPGVVVQAEAPSSGPVLTPL